MQKRFIALLVGREISRNAPPGRRNPLHCASIRSAPMFLSRTMCSTSGDAAPDNAASPVSNRTARQRRDHTPSYCFPSGQRISQLKSNLKKYRYHVFRSPTQTGIMGKKVGQAPNYRGRDAIHAPHRMLRKMKRFGGGVPLRDGNNNILAPKRKPNMKSNLLPIGGGKHSPNLALKLLQQVNVSEMVRSIVLGALLGHGNLFVDRERYPDMAVFYFRNHVTNKEYFDWKVEQMQEMSFEQSLGTRAGKLEYRTKPVPELKPIHFMTCKQNHTDVKRKWLNHMTPVSLAIWWCDRGNIISHGTKGQLVTDQFRREAVELIQRYLFVMWKVEAHISVVHRADRLSGKSRVEHWYYRLHLRTSQLKIFLRIIMRYIPVPGMIKKAFIYYGKPDLQQSWIEEMKQAMPQWCEEIDQVAAARKEELRGIKTAKAGRKRLRKQEQREKQEEEQGARV